MKKINVAFSAFVAAFVLFAAAGCGDSSNWVVDVDPPVEVAETSPEIAQTAQTPENAETAPAAQKPENAETAPAAQTPENAETAPAAQKPENAETAPAAQTFDALVAAGMKVDGNGKIVDFSDVEGLDGFDFAADRARWSAVKVARGKGVVTTNTLFSLALLPNLTELLWSDALCVFPNASDAQAFRKLEGVKTLKKVRLTRLRDEEGNFPRALSELGFIPNLEELDVSDSPLTADDWKGVAERGGAFPKLKKLNLYRTNLGDSGVDAILPLADRLVSLNLDDAKIGPASADKIAQFSHLTFLHVGRSEFDDESVLKFAKLEKLEKIHITRSKATEAGADALRAKMPRCVVVSQPEI